MNLIHKSNKSNKLNILNIFNILNSLETNKSIFNKTEKVKSFYILKVLQPFISYFGNQQIDIDMKNELYKILLMKDSEKAKIFCEIEIYIDEKNISIVRVFVQPTESNLSARKNILNVDIERQVKVIEEIEEWKNRMIEEFY